MDLKNIKPISYIKANAAQVLDRVNETHTPYVVTQNGEARAVIIDPETYQKTQDALKLLRLLAQGEADIAKGKVISQEEVFASLEKMLNDL